ncbi:NHLP leader peptide family RiPP precursor [Aquimarina sp. 2201CG1-2-11]|uniref:NHLP leader peptide family RiPP precursor n=1 Tax=Aquimarina discodermiae TaxID=3231043 RepID=UPI0034630033
MKLTEQQQKSHEFMNSLISKCWEDASFKQELINNPEATIEKFAGQPITLAEGKKLVVVDQTNDKNVYINIPAEPNLDELELTDEQLELVAGGVLPLILTIASGWWIGGGFTVGVGLGIAAS